MLGVRGFVEHFHLFERNKVPLDLKVLGLAFYVEMSSLGRTARALSKCRRVSKTAVWKWVQKLKLHLGLSVDVKPRHFIAIGETCVRVSGLNLLGLLGGRR